jgi:hypothetical protein
MANAIYPKWKEAVMQASSNSSLGGTVKVSLVDTGTYTYSAAHEFFSSLSGVTASTSAGLATKTYVSGLFDADNITFSAVSGAVSEALVIWIDTGVAGTSRLVAFIDTGVSGLPVTPNGGDITVSWNASGIFQL